MTEPPAHPLLARAPPLWVSKVILLFVTVVAWTPILAVLGTLGAVMATGCDVNEARSQPCMVAGHDIGDVLGTGLLMAFIAGPALPFAIGTAILWIVLRRRRRAAGRGGQS